MALHLAISCFRGLELILFAVVDLRTARDRRRKPSDLVRCFLTAFIALVVPLQASMRADCAVAYEPLHAEEVGGAKERRGLRYAG